MSRLKRVLLKSFTDSYFFFYFFDQWSFIKMWKPWYRLKVIRMEYVYGSFQLNVPFFFFWRSRNFRIFTWLLLATLPFSNLINPNQKITVKNNLREVNLTLESLKWFRDIDKVVFYMFLHTTCCIISLRIRFKCKIPWKKNQFYEVIEELFGLGLSLRYSLKP